VPHQSMTATGVAWRAIRDQFRSADIDTPDGVIRLAGFAERRLSGEPVARILGHKEFYGLDFALNAATLVPRPETELLVELALEALKGIEAPLILDLGTGSGCVAIAILVHAPNARAIATDVSPEAIAAAEENAGRHLVSDRIEFRSGSWCRPLRPDDRFDVIVSNPPYVETDIIEQLQPEVSDHDPRLALDGGEDGLVAYRLIAAGVPGRLKPGGPLMVEVGSEQGLEVGAILSTAGFAGVDIRKDLAGLDRVVIAHQV
jgi:release factor glutamine methyltransferase